MVFQGFAFLLRLLPNYFYCNRSIFSFAFIGLFNFYPCLFFCKPFFFILTIFLFGCASAVFQCSAGSAIPFVFLRAFCFFEKRGISSEFCFLDRSGRFFIFPTFVRLPFPFFRCPGSFAKELLRYHSSGDLRPVRNPNIFSSFLFTVSAIVGFSKILRRRIVFFFLRSAAASPIAFCYLLFFFRRICFFCNRRCFTDPFSFQRSSFAFAAL